jgi:nucleotide-binding universal stress UspA family protein
MAEVTDQRSRGRIVVGVDGSQASKEALVWAAREAELTGATLEVVKVWEMPFGSHGRVIQVPGELDHAVEEERKLQDTVHEVLGDDYDSEPWEQPGKLKTVVLEGRPVPTLLDVARGADLLVIGRSGHGAFVGTLLGSVSEHCIGRASCPVVVVRPTERAA